MAWFFLLWVLGTGYVSVIFLVLKQNGYYRVVSCSYSNKHSINKSSNAYQLSRKIELLKKERKFWKKQCHNKDFHNIEQIENELVYKPILWIIRQIIWLVPCRSAKESIGSKTYWTGHSLGAKNLTNMASIWRSEK